MELSVLARVVVNIFMLSAVVNNATLHVSYREPLTGVASVGSPEQHDVNHP